MSFELPIKFVLMVPQSFGQVKVVEFSPPWTLESCLDALFPQESFPQSFENLSPTALHVLQIEIWAPAKVQIDADGCQPKVFSAQSGFSVTFFRESIRNLRGD